jgi:hypothetical protein
MKAARLCSDLRDDPPGWSKLFLNAIIRHGGDAAPGMIFHYKLSGQVHDLTW